MRPLPRHAPRSIVALCLALFSLAAAPAARATVTVTANGSSATYLFGNSTCNAGTAVTFAYDFSASSYANSSPTVIIRATPNSDCSADSTKGYTYTPPSQSAKTGSVSVKLSDFLFGTACNASTTTTSANPGVAYFCVLLQVNSTVDDSGHVTVNYAMQPPGAPVGITVQPGDAQLHVSWTPQDASATIANYQVFCESDAADGGPGTFDTTKYSTQVSGTDTAVGRTGIDGGALVNGDAYTVAVSATDTYGNASPLSAPLAGQIPEPVLDFYGYYQSDGGSARGGHGCQSAEGTLWSALVAVALIFVVRKRRSMRARISSTMLVGLLVLFSAAGSARADDSMLGSTSSIQRADRRVFFAIEADRYTPRIDSEKDLNGATPYRDIFKSRIPWRVQGELAWEALPTRNFGSFLIGGSFGFWQNFGKGIFASGPNKGQPSSDTTLLDIWPMGVEAQWRYDGLCERYRWLPIIPYAKAGLMAALWTIYSGNGAVAKTSTGRGSGWTTGYTTALGVAISLDAIDPSISNEAYIDLGLQRTSVFAEYGWTRLDGFRSGGVLILSDRQWRFGLSLEF